MKKAILIIFPIVFLLMSSGCKEEMMNVQSESTIPVRVEALQLKSIREYVTATGTVVAAKEMALALEQAGYYQLQTNPRTGRPFAMGDNVKSGEKLVVLTNPEYVNSIAIDSKKLNFESSERELEKQKAIYDKGGITLSELTSAESTFINARYTYENALLSLAKLEIKAPFSGTIVQLDHYTQNQWLGAGASVVSVMDYSTLFSDVTLPGKEMDRVSRNQKATVTNFSSAVNTLDARIDQISPALDPTSRMFTLRLKIPNPNLSFKPGMFIKADIIVNEKESALVIPKDIIRDNRGRPTVYVVERGFAMERRLQTGMENPDEIEVIEGLKENDSLVIEGFETLRNQSRVNVLK
ncbi:MAG: efflux RND transporter periplasmic adaptor subunit [Candidatus Aminicenantes bacterium]|nr:efflux RND transporter periplasmic adaptor subunit [Candidatus Aminicenantes bacterium]